MIWSSPWNQQKSPKYSTWVQSQKCQSDLCFQGKPFNIRVIQIYSPTTNAKEDKVEWSYVPTRPSRTNTIKRCPFHHRGMECKSRKSRDTRKTGKVGLGVQNESGQRLTEFCQENALIIAKASSNNTRDDSMLGCHQIVNTKIRLIIFFVAKEEALYH